MKIILLKGCARKRTIATTGTGCTAAYIIYSETKLKREETGKANGLLVEYFEEEIYQTAESGFSFSQGLFTNQSVTFLLQEFLNQGLYMSVKNLFSLKKRGRRMKELPPL